ncbi:MAG: enoyl-CoA hydratase/isomerase family protein [Alphaproteobacteria bacterium]
MPLIYETDGEVATFTIDNGKVNPLNPEIHKQFYKALDKFQRDRSLKVGILTATGDRAFSAGDDLKTPRKALEGEDRVMRHYYPHTNEDDEPNYPGWEREVLRMKRFKPIIGAVKGWCLGQGMIYLLHLTDLRVAGKSAKFGLPEIAYGMGGAAGMARIYRHLPRVEAMRLCLTGDAIDAAEAFRINLVNEVVEDAQVLERAKTLAARITRHPLMAIRTEMEVFVRCEDLDSDNAYALTDHMFRLQRVVSDTQNWEVDFKKKGVKGG